MVQGTLFNMEHRDIKLQFDQQGTTGKLIHKLTFNQMKWLEQLFINICIAEVEDLQLKMLVS